MAAFAAGSAAALGQIALLRQFLELAAGFEPAAGLLLSSWLLWTALGSWLGAALTRRKQDRRMPGLLLALQGLCLASALPLARAVRPLAGLAVGRTPELDVLLTAALALPAPLCLCSGALFAACWAAATHGGASARPVGVYVAEALGAGVAGLAFLFLILPLAPVSLGVLVASALCAASGAWLLHASRPNLPRGGRARDAASWIAALAAVAAVSLLGAWQPLERASRSWQWGDSLMLTRDTPYASLAFVGGSDAQEPVSVFADGAWLFTVPDPQAREQAVHPALLQHPAPQSVLILGGDGRALLQEALAHTGVASALFVDLETTASDLAHGLWAEAAMNRAGPGSGLDRRMLARDPARFLATDQREWDVILVQLGGPSTAGRSRFYCLEFFELAKTRLAPGGVFSFSLEASPDALGPVQLDALRAVRATLATVFADVLVVPGEQARFLAAAEPGVLSADPALLGERLRSRNLDLTYVREDFLRDDLSPFRLDQWESQLTAEPLPPLNRRFRPVCFFATLTLWARQMSDSLHRPLQALAAQGPWPLWALAGLLAFTTALTGLGRPRILAGTNQTPPPSCARAVGVCSLLAGGAAMVLQIALILGVQIALGALSSLIAALVAACMAGLALGAGWAMRVSDHHTRTRSPAGQPPLRALAAAHAALCAALLALPLLLQLLAEPWAAPAAWAAFPLLALAAGVLGGCHFGLAAACWARCGRDSTATGGLLYGLDLAGAAGASLLASLLFIPLYGLPATLAAAALATMGGLAALAPWPRRSLGGRFGV